MDEEIEYEEECECEPPAYRWSHWLPLIAVFQVLVGFAQGLKFAVDHLLEGAIAASNHEVLKRDKQDFESGARADIERLTADG